MTRLGMWCSQRPVEHGVGPREDREGAGLHFDNAPRQYLGGLLLVMQRCLICPTDRGSCLGATLFASQNECC